MTDRRRGPGDLEAEILAALWAADHPLIPREVMESVDRDLAYNTVQTILIRLLDKGAVTRQPAGRAHAYSPVLDQAGMAARRMRAELDRGGDQIAVLSRFLGTLSDEEQRMAIELLRAHRRR